MRTSTVMARTGVGVLALAAAAAIHAPAGSAATAAGTATGSTQSCSIVWGSLPRASEWGYQYNFVTDVRTGRHECFDRVVVDADMNPQTLRRELDFDVRYVDRLMTDEGEWLDLRGGAMLAITVGARSGDDTGWRSYDPADRYELVDVTGYDTLRQLAWVNGMDDLDGSTTLGVGTRARLPFRAFTIVGPGDEARHVVDIAHHW